MEDPKRTWKEPHYELIALANEFPFVQHKTIQSLLSRHQTLLEAYEAVNHLDQSDSSKRLRRPRPKDETCIPSGIQREVERIRRIVAESDNAGNLVECRSCFVDVAPKLAIPCSGHESHFYCYPCIKEQAETQIREMRYDIKCSVTFIDASECGARFEYAFLQQALGEKFLNRLEFLQQMDEFTTSGIKGLEGCPFCEFKAICLPPVPDEGFPGQPPQFSCQNLDCGKVSCRLCQIESHTPKTCEQATNKCGVPECPEMP